MKKRKILWEKVWRYSGILFLSVFVFLAISGGPVFAAEEENTIKVVASGNLSEYENPNISWTLTSDGTLTISGEGDLPSWWTGKTTPIEQPEPAPMALALEDTSEEEETSTENEPSINPVDYPTPWQEYVDDINKVVIEEGITSISPFSFANCYSVAQLKIGDSVTALEEYAFFSCISLQSVTFPQYITGIYPYSFSNCSSLESVSLPDGVTRIGDCAFENCQSLETINMANNQIREFDYRAFFGCSSLKELPIGNRTEIIGYSAFYGCKLIKTVAFPDSIKTVEGAAFHGCSSITTLEWPGHLRRIPMDCFGYCTSLRTVSIPDGVTEIAQNAFSNCTSLTDINLGKDIQTLDGCFGACTSLQSIELPADLIVIGDFTFCRCTSLEKLEIPEGVSFIGSFAFDACESLTKINLPSSIKRIEDGAFYNCKALTSIQLPSGITEIKSATFFNCTALTSIQLPSGITQIGENAFASCHLLESIDMPEELVSLGYRSFSDCNALKTINFNSKLKEIGEWCFVNCDKLEQIIIPESVTEIKEYAFFGDDLLKEVNLGNGALEKIGNKAFQYTPIVTIDIPQNVTEIGEYAFENCTSLQGVVIRGDAVAIGEQAFSNCSSMHLIMFKGQKGEIANDAFQGITATASYPLCPRWKEIPKATDYSATHIVWLDEFSLKSSNAIFEPEVLKLINSIKLESVYSFSNTGATVDGEYFVPIYGWATDASREEVLAIFDSLGASGKAGLCSGFTLTAASFNEYSRPLFGTKKLGQYSKNDCDGQYQKTVWDWIKYGWVYSNGSAAACYETNINMDKCDEIYNKVNAYQQGSGGPVLIEISPGNMEDGGGHSLWALGIGKEEEEWVDVIVYDPNYPRIYKTLTLFKENGVVSNNWEYQHVDNYGWSSSNGGHISYMEIADDFAHWINQGITAENVPWSGDYSQYLTANHSGLILRAEIEDIHSKTITIQQKVSGKRDETVEQIVDGTAKKITMAVEEVFKFVMPKLGLFNATEDDGENNDSVEYWMNVGDTYTILNPTDSVIKYSTSTPNSGVLIDLPSGASAETTVSENKLNKIKFTLAENQKITFTYLDTKSDGSDVNKLKITAQGSSQITSKQQTDGVSVTGASGLVIGEGGDSCTFKNLDFSETYIIKGISDSSDTRTMTVVNGATGEKILSQREQAALQKEVGINQAIGNLQPQDVKVEAIRLTCLSKKIAAGKKVAVQATVFPANASNQTLTWKSSNTKIAVVNNKGVVTFRKKSGGKKVTIIAQTTDGSNVSASVKLNSMKGIVKKISISGKNTVKAGKSIKLKANVKATPKANKTVLWSSSNPAYATVNAKGKVTANKNAKGKKVRITAKATDGSGKKKTITIKIK